MTPKDSDAVSGSAVSEWKDSASDAEGIETTPKCERRAAESEVTREAEDPRPVLFVDVIALGKGEKGSRAVLV